MGKGFSLLCRIDGMEEVIWRDRSELEVSILGIIDDTFWITILSQPRFDSLRFGRRATRTRMRCANEEHKMEMKMEMRTDDNERRSFELLLLRTPSLA